jgi:hypothetical protein
MCITVFGNCFVIIITAAFERNNNRLIDLALLFQSCGKKKDKQSDQMTDGFFFAEMCKRTIVMGDRKRFGFYALKKLVSYKVCKRPYFCFRGCLHVRLSIRIPIRFGVRFAGKGVQQVFFFFFLTKCINVGNRMAIRTQIRTRVDSPLVVPIPVKTAFGVDHNCIFFAVCCCENCVNNVIFYVK